ncbi:MAG: M28 family peptidase [Rubrobacter sp.]|nr:M28 family peptidase [Rubrobacter sp.]
MVQTFEKHGLQTFGNSFIQPFSFFSRENNKEYRGANVVGYVEGASDPEHYIVVTTHYDYLSVINKQIYNGADDNASGTAALFAVVGYFSKHRPDTSIIVPATDGEEFGEESSKAFVAHPPVAGTP